MFKITAEEKRLILRRRTQSAIPAAKTRKAIETLKKKIDTAKSKLAEMQAEMKKLRERAKQDKAWEKTRRMHKKL